MLFIFGLCLCEEGLQLPPAKRKSLGPKSPSWNPSIPQHCKMINASEAAWLQMFLTLPTEGELWLFSVGLWAEGIGNCLSRILLFFCIRRKSSLPLLIVCGLIPPHSAPAWCVIPCHFPFWVLKSNWPIGLRRLNFQILVSSSVCHTSLHFPSLAFDWQLSSETLLAPQFKSLLKLLNESLTFWTVMNYLNFCC